MSDENMTQREKEIFVCTEVLAKTILDREWVVGPPVNITIRVETRDELVIEVSLNIGE